MKQLYRWRELSAMRVLTISKAYVAGTSHRKLEELAKCPGVELIAVTPPYWLADDGSKQELERVYLEGYELIVTPMALNGHFHIHYYPQLSSIMRRVRPDIVHIDEEPYNFATYQAIRLARRYGALPIFSTFQNLYRRYPPPFRQFELYCYHQAQHAQACNKAAGEVLRRKGYKGKIHLIAQFGAEPSLHYPDPQRRPYQPGEPFILGYVGRLKEEKGVPLIIEALAMLPECCRVVFIGYGPLRDELERMAQRLGVAERVTFLGSLPSYKVPDEMRKMHVLLQPSLTRPNWMEQFGRSMAEAMCCEVPVVGSSSGEIPVTVGDGGLIFPEGDARAMAECVRRLLEDQDLYQRLARQARQHILQNYTQEAIARKTYEVFLEMLAERDAATSTPTSAS
jgi:glycosyltransferase involved in cell wall biosynthesis